jgi:hypothetical protein
VSGLASATASGAAAGAVVGGVLGAAGGIAAGCGGMSFTPRTKVLLANGKAVPIATLKRGEKVLATNTRTGKTQAEPVAAVLVHHDANRYNLAIKTGHRTAVIHTTTTHLFWDQTTHRWIKAAALRHGTHLRAPSGQATVISGYRPRNRAGWMWDLTITHDHDFYVATAIATVLVHNCPAGETSAEDAALGKAIAEGRVAADAPLGHLNGAIAEELGWQDAISNGEIGIQGPGKVTAPGPDFITYNRETGSINLWDATAGKTPKQLPVPEYWMPEARAAVASYTGPYAAEIQQALANGQVDTLIFRYIPKAS